jgi:alcohol dehydrogenase
VLIRIRAAGLCHSDLSAIDGVRPRERAPRRSSSGTRRSAGAQTGAGVDDLVPGDRVVTLFVPSCGQCAMCLEGRPALCVTAPQYSGAGTLASGAIRFRHGGRPVHHYVGVAAFAEMTVMMRRSLVKIDADVPTDAAALIGCAVLTGAGAVFNTARLRPGESVAVVGLGGVGLSALMAHARRGERHRRDRRLWPKLALAASWERRSRSARPIRSASPRSAPPPAVGSTSRSRWRARRRRWRSPTR